jgi:hypothetical protein
MRYAHRPRAIFLCLKKISPSFPNSRSPSGSGNDMGFAALMAAGSNVGSTAHMAVCQPPSRKFLVFKKKKHSPNFSAATPWGKRKSMRAMPLCLWGV